MKQLLREREFFITIVLASMLLAVLLTGCAGGAAKESTGEYVDGQAITAKVKTQLLRDPDVSGIQVKVETYRGQVQLSGFVDTPAQKTKAAEVARNVPGVRSVKNDLIVKSKS